MVGFTPPKGTRADIGSLLLAVNDAGQLRYAGRVGSGMPDEMLRDLSRRLRQWERPRTPLGSRPAGIPGVAHWVEPRMVVEVAFTEWTTDGLLRHPVFQGVREDKPAREVRREEPKMTPRIAARARRAAPLRQRSQPAARNSTAAVAGVAISHPDRVVYPESGVTKLEVARYFERIAPLLLPHAAGRPLSLVRCPDGSAGECFFQKHWPGTPPAAIDTVPIRQSTGIRRYVVIHDVAGLITLIQWGVLEIHVWGSRADDLEHPDRVVFDLDPGPGVGWDDVKDAARGLHGLLDGLGLSSWLKTSGGKGLHVVVPIARRATWDEASAFARAVAEHMQAEFPDRFISRASKSARRGVIFVDWLRNTRGATAVAPWSTRARAAAGVSVPISWSRLNKLKAGDEFTLLSIRSNPPRGGDPWQQMLTARQALSKAIVERLA